jgi:predicted glycosyltransferase
MITPAASSLDRPAPRFLLYSHDGFGLGHTRRHIAIAAALVEMAPHASVLLASGADDIYRLGLPPRVETLKLPGLRKVANGNYQSRRLAIPIPEIRALRSALLETTVKSFRPDVALVDKHPFGANGEFSAALAALKQSGGRAALGLRDILDERTAVLTEWTADNVNEGITTFYDRVLVYGEQSVFDPVAEYQFSQAVAERTSFCGYVVRQEDLNGSLARSAPPMRLRAQARGRPIVVATTGGGEDGFFLLETFIRAAAGAAWQGVVIAGPMTPEHEFKTLRAMAAESGVPFHSFVPNLPALFYETDALVSMGGYNTLVEAVATGVPIVCVPRVAPRREQQLRAQTFERLGLLRALRPDQLSVETLRQSVQLALRSPRRDNLDRVNAALTFDGARKAAGHMLALADEAHS